MTSSDLLSSAGSQAAPPPAGQASAWERPSARIGGVRLCAGACLAGFAIALATDGQTRILAPFVLTDIALLALPWRVPRTGRSMVSIWLENLASQAMPLAVLMTVLIIGPPWLRNFGSWWWYPVAACCGAALITFSGLSLKMLIRGDLAFLAGPRPKAHAAAHAVCAVTAPAGEEFLFRGVVFLTSGASAVVIPAIALAAFVARHHLPRPTAPKVSRQEVATQAASALVTVGLVAVSRSLYPAIMAHLVNNGPQILLAVQRGRTGGHK